MCATSSTVGQRHLVNNHGVKAGWFIPFVDKRVGENVIPRGRWRTCTEKKN